MSVSRQLHVDGREIPPDEEDSSLQLVLAYYYQPWFLTSLNEFIDIKLTASLRSHRDWAHLDDESKVTVDRFQNELVKITHLAMTRAIVDMGEVPFENIRYFSTKSFDLFYNQFQPKNPPALWNVIRDLIKYTETWF